jgi:hypothetical protein
MLNPFLMRPKLREMELQGKRKLVAVVGRCPFEIEPNPFDGPRVRVHETSHGRHSGIGGCRWREGTSQYY